MKFSLSVRFTVLCLLAVLAGCATLPDMKGFTDQTATMVASVNSGVEESQDLFKAAEGNNTVSIQRLLTSWNATANCTKGVLAYSAALSAVVDAGNKGKESATQIGNAVNGLLKVVEQAPIASGVVAGVASISGEVIMIKSSYDLKHAVEAAEPSVNASARIVRNQIEDLKELYLSTGQDLRTILEASGKADYAKYYNEMAAEELLLVQKLVEIQRIEFFRHQAKNMKYMAQLGVQTDKLTKYPGYAVCKKDEKDRPAADVCAQVLETKANGVEADLTKWDAGLGKEKDLGKRRSDLLHDLELLEGRMDRLEGRAKAYTAELDALDTRLRNGSKLLDKAAKAVTEWQKAHGKLLPAIRKSQVFSIQEFALAVKELSDAYSKLTGGK